MTEEHQQSKEETIKFKQTITTLENELHQSVKTAGHLRTKIALVEQEVKSKQEVLQQTNDRIAIEQDSKVRKRRILCLDIVDNRLEKVRRNCSAENGENDGIETRSGQRK